MPLPEEIFYLDYQKVEKQKPNIIHMREIV